jgi:hypothetical protein
MDKFVAILRNWISKRRVRREIREGLRDSDADRTLSVEEIRARVGLPE